jgi:hydroxymethylglutaryl-CoA lyase
VSEAIYITEVAPRDGLQNEKQLITADDKVRLVRMLDPTGVDEIEVSSFVSPKWVPQLADAAEVFAKVARLIDRITLFTAASESFARKNTNASIAETLERFKPVIAAARQHGLNVRAYISTVIRCPYEGPVAPAAVADVSTRLLELGVDDIDLGDTIGAATPESTRELLKTAIAAIGRANIAKLTLHLHDTFGRAAECVPVALEMGLRSFDGAAGGLGGCPYASTPEKRAPGNLATETLVRAIERGGFRTGVNLEKLEAAGEFARRLVSADARAAR